MALLSKIVVGELGMHGVNPVGDGSLRAVALRSAQRNACARQEFQWNTQFTPTAQYAVLNGTNYDGIHHYNGRADTIFHVGEAFGHAMVQLLDKNKSMTNWSGVWINEFHYHNTGTDANEFIEIGHDVSLTGYQVKLFADGIGLYSAISLTGIPPSLTLNSISYTVVEYLSDGGIDNRARSGGVLVDPNGTVIEFLSYGGTISAFGVVSTNIGVVEKDDTPASHSLQRCPNSGLWTGPLPNTKGRPNANCTANTPLNSPTTAPTRAPGMIPVRDPTNAPIPSSCGFFRFNFFGLGGNGCGFFRRLFGWFGC
jgi:hypothetical protein